MGPGAAIILPEGLLQEGFEAIDRVLNQVCERVELKEDGQEFWVTDTRCLGGDYIGLGEPFIITISGIEPLMDAEEADVIERTFGFRPIQTIEINAGCNSTEDHKILGTLTLNFAEIFNGIVDFNGALLPPIPNDWKYWEMSWNEIEPLFNDWIKQFPGRIVGFDYEPIPHRKWTSHKVDVEFFRAWLNYPNFYMIK